jgi:hypothetical protein
MALQLLSRPCSCSPGRVMALLGCSGQPPERPSTCALACCRRVIDVAGLSRQDVVEIARMVRAGAGLLAGWRCLALSACSACTLRVSAQTQQC